MSTSYFEVYIPRLDSDFVYSFENEEYFHLFLWT